MYKLFTDKTELFECNISLQGASLKKSKARLVVETPEYSLLFNGTISKGGKCEIPIKKLKGLIDENTSGNIRLEVIAEDTFFTPWESDFVVETSKKVTVEVKSQNKTRIVERTKPAIQVANIKNVAPAKLLKESTHIVRILKMLIKENVTLKNLPSKKHIVNRVIASYSKKYTITESKQKRIINGIVKVLSKRK